MLQYFKAS